MLSFSPPLERARPLLGTVVAIRVYGLAPTHAHEAIDAAFSEIARIHALMSFHDEDSDVSRLNRDAIEAPVPVHGDTRAVLAEALSLSEASKGIFDVSIAATLVQRGLLPRPLSLREPETQASWRDIELCADGRVRFHRPLWIDLGGIAKGYAVDCAIRALSRFGVERACVNAGGDLRVLGDVAEPVYLRTGHTQNSIRPIVTIAAGSLASSGALDPTSPSPHIDACRPDRLLPPRFVSVVAERCLIADALTKVVQVSGFSAQPLLVHYKAQAYFLEESGPWISLAAAA